MRVDLAAQTVTGADGKTYRFDIDAYRKRCLIEGLDELAFTLGQRDAIVAFEQKHTAAMPCEGIVRLTVADDNDASLGGGRRACEGDSGDCRRHCGDGRVDDAFHVVSSRGGAGGAFPLN
jgi:hypothetical protein